MKKVILVICVLIAGAAALFIYNAFSEGQAPAEEAEEAEALESYEDSLQQEDPVYEDVEFQVVDGSESYSDSDLEELTDELTDRAVEYFKILTDMDEDTKDYTDKLKELYGTKYESPDLETLGNRYKYLSDLGTESQFQSIDLALLKIIDSDPREVHMLGRADIEMKNDELEEGSYVIPFNAVFYKDGKQWALYQVSMHDIYQSDGFRFVWEPGSDKTVIDSSGDTALTLDFSGYTVDNDEFDEANYDQVYQYEAD